MGCSSSGLRAEGGARRRRQSYSPLAPPESAEPGSEATPEEARGVLAQAVTTLERRNSLTDCTVTEVIPPSLADRTCLLGPAAPCEDEGASCGRQLRDAGGLACAPAAGPVAA
ncbi:unnamed protein product, partial [Prorocentrum cordatum]